MHAPDQNTEPDGTPRPWLERDRRPDGVDDATVEAVGKLSEAVEYVERARGHLYELHQLSGRADLLIGEAADALADAGHERWAEHLRTDLVGRNLLEGRWSFQIVEEYDATYWSPVRESLRAVEADLLAGRRHVYESEMKDDRRTDGRRHHERRPDPSA